MPAVLDALPAVVTEDGESALDVPRSAPQADAAAVPGHRLLVDCAICESTHPPGTEPDPACPEDRWV